AAIAGTGFAVGEVNFNVVMIEEGSVERINGLIYSFLGNKEQPSAIGMISIYCYPLARRRHQIQQLGWQRFGGLDVDSYPAYVTAHSDGRNCDARVVRQGADNACGPRWCSPRTSRQGAFRLPQSPEELACDNPSGAASTPHLINA